MECCHGIVTVVALNSGIKLNLVAKILATKFGGFL